MWIGVKDAYSGAAITYAYFNYAYQNYGGGWYWVAVPQNAYLYTYASGYNTAVGWTNGHSSFNVYMTKPTSTGGSGW